MTGQATNHEYKTLTIATASTPKQSISANIEEMRLTYWATCLQAKKHKVYDSCTAPDCKTRLQRRDDASRTVNYRRPHTIHQRHYTICSVGHAIQSLVASNTRLELEPTPSSVYAISMLQRQPLTIRTGRPTTLVTCTQLTQYTYTLMFFHRSHHTTKTEPTTPLLRAS